MSEPVLRRFGHAERERYTRDHIDRVLDDRLKRSTDLLAEQLRDELHVRFGRINIRYDSLNNLFTMEQQRDLAIAGRLFLVCDGLDRLWAVEVTP